MSYPTNGNLGPSFVELADLAAHCAVARRKAMNILDDIRPALIGQRVTRYGRTWEICQVQVGLSGHVTCYGVTVSKRGKVGRRGFDLGNLSHCDFVK